MAASPKLERDALLAGRYQIVELLGKGGMAEVYRAFDRQLDETIALKVLTTPDGQHALDRFRQEVRLARRVTHPNVARVFDIGSADGLTYLTMELIEGPTLRALLEHDGAIAVDRAVAIARDVAAGLQAAHAMGVIHRDLKPANLLLEPSGRSVITDFGIARDLDLTSSLTQGGFIGTPRYMAPEQAMGSPVDARVDLYALGLVMYEMITGAVPRADAADLAAVPGMVPALAALVRRCLAVDPEDRPRSAAEVERALAPLVEREPVPGLGFDWWRELRMLEGGQHGSSAWIQGEVSAASTRDDRAVVAPVRQTLLVDTPGPDASASTGSGPLLATLPFRYHGPPAEAYFGDLITGELIDVLSRTPHLRVCSLGATERFREARDPQRIGRELGAYAVIDGSVQRSGEQMRIVARLIEARTAVQLWSETYEGGLGDLFTLQARIARRVGEALRIELARIEYGVGAPPAAMEHYLAARQRLRVPDYAGSIDAVELFGQALALAPRFKPAIAGLALATVRCWFLPNRPSDRAWEQEASRNVDRALADAEELPESHLAAAMRSGQLGDYADVVRRARRALALAPTYAAALEYLGMLQCEAGPVDEGLRRLELAEQLDPTLSYASIMLAREQALRGRYDKFLERMDAMDERTGYARLALAHLRLRVANWYGDHETLRGLSHETQASRGIIMPLEFLVSAALGLVDGAELDARFAAHHARAESPRARAFLSQLGAELQAGCGRHDLAEAHVIRATDDLLIDLEWLDRCPILAEIRTRPGFAVIREVVRGRAVAIWTASG